jgi:hypothetical protein
LQVAFEIIGVISVITNCALIGMDPGVQKLLPSDITAVNTVIIFVAVEVSRISLLGYNTSLQSPLQWKHYRCR